MPMMSGAKESALVEDFDNMLARIRTEDVAVVNQSSSSSRSSTSNNNQKTAKVSDADIWLSCCKKDTAKLSLWARQGVRVFTANLPCAGAALGRLDVVGYLVQYFGADFNQANKIGKTPLHAAAVKGLPDMVQYLVKVLGVDVNKADNIGSTALLIAARKGNLDVVCCLVDECGADVKRPDSNGWSPLYRAAQFGHLAIVRYLANVRGADVNQASKTGHTPLCMAAEEGYLEIVKCLVDEFGADAHTTNIYGGTPLFMASMNGQLQMVKYLVRELGADVNQTAQDGETPLMMASFRKHEEVAKFLIKNGANAQARSPVLGTAADTSVKSPFGAPDPALTAFLEAKAHCSNPGCSGAGLKKCAGCKLVQHSYCGTECQVAHWPAHKAECKRIKKANKAEQEKAVAKVGKGKA